MKVLTTVESGVRPVLHVAGRHAAALYPACERPSMRTNGHGWRDVVDVVHEGGGPGTWAPEHYLRVAVGAQRRRAHPRRCGRLAPIWPSTSAV